LFKQRVTNSYFIY